MIATGVFVILLSQDGFERDSPERNPKQSKPYKKQRYADVLHNRFFRNFSIFPEKHLRWSLFLINFIERRLQHRCFLLNIAKCFDRKPPVASADLLFIIKSNVRWFLLKRVDLVIVRAIYRFLVGTIPTRFTD